MNTHDTIQRLSTGISGLDEILCGGLIPGRAYLVRGGPGAGKTTLGLHFLTAGVAAGEKCLYITLEEPETHIRKNASSSGFDLEGVAFLDLSPTSEFFAKAETYDIFSPAEVEREPTAKRIMETVQSLKPVRVFIDPMTQFRYLTADIYQFRKQVLSFLRFLVDQGATVLFSSEGSEEAPDSDLQFMSDGVLHLEWTPYGRTVTVSKFRGSAFRAGKHGLRLTSAGMAVFPRLEPEAYRAEFKRETIPSGVPELDEMLNGGLERGTVSILTGPSGVGKTTLGLQFMKEAAGRGERSIVYSFEEEVEIMLSRCDGVGIPARTMIQQGTLSIVKIEPLQYTTDEFARLVRGEIEEKQTRMVMIDSTAGYQLSLRGENLVAQLHALAKYLQNMGVTVLLVTEVADVVGNFRVSDLGISYLGDNTIFMRFLEINGEMRKAIGVLKKRLSSFERTLREIEITRYGIKVGKPLTGLRGILHGTPEWVKGEEK